MKSLENRIALVTSSTRGIGLAIVKDNLQSVYLPSKEAITHMIKK